MGNQVVKFGNFKSGSAIRIHYNPTFELKSKSVEFNGYLGDGKYSIRVGFGQDMTFLNDTEYIISCGSFSSDYYGVETGDTSYVRVYLDVSAFPDTIAESEYGKYLGYDIQTFLFFPRGQNEIDTEVSQMSAETEAAMYGYHEDVYDTNTSYAINTTLIRLRNDDGTINQLVASKGYVLENIDICGDTPTNVNSNFSQFPVPLGGGVVDNGFVKASLMKRAALTQRNTFKGQLSFKLIG